MRWLIGLSVSIPICSRGEGRQSYSPYSEGRLSRWSGWWKCRKVNLWSFHKSNLNSLVRVEIFADSFCAIINMLYYSLTVVLTLNGVTAVGGGNDFNNPTTTTVTFSQDQTFVDKNIPIISDNRIEELETFTITLGNAVNGAIGRPNVATVYILDETCK